MGLIFDHRKQSPKHDKELDGGTSGQPDKRNKKDTRRRDDMLVAATGQKGRKPSIEEAIDHFEEMLEAPCPKHRFPVWHAYKDGGLLRKFKIKNKIESEIKSLLEIA